MEAEVAQMLWRRSVLGLLLSTGAAWAQSPRRAPFVEKAAKRFPQPVRVGDLIGREVLEPNERERVLGRVAAIRRARDNGIDLAMRFGGVLGLGSRLIEVPIEAMALLGEYVVAVDLTPAELSALPTAPETGDALGAEESIRVGLVRPFH